VGIPPSAWMWASRCTRPTPTAAWWRIRVTIGTGTRASHTRLAHAPRTLCRRTKGSHRRRKAARGVACKHLVIARQRRDLLFKTAEHSAERYSRMRVDDLNRAGIVRNHHLAKSIHDAELSPMRRVRPDKRERADAYLSALRLGRRPRHECRKEHRTGGGTAFRDGGRWGRQMH
jgi:hypothetical protein